LIPVVQCCTGYWSTDAMYCAHGQQFRDRDNRKKSRAILDV
jgi:hypothetical protein